MHIRGLERLPKGKEFWYNVSGAEGTTALAMLFKRLREMLFKKLLSVPDSGLGSMCSLFSVNTSDEISRMPNGKWNVCRLWNLALASLRHWSGDWQRLGRWLSPQTSHHLQQSPGSLWENPLTFHTGEWVRGPKWSLMAWKSINQRTNLSVASFQGCSLLFF